MQSSHQQQQLDVTRRRFVQSVLQSGPVQPVVEEPPRPAKPEEPKEDVYDDQPAVFDMDDDDDEEEETITDCSAKSTDTDSAQSPNTGVSRPPRSQTAVDRSGLEFMPSVAVSEQRSSGRLSSMSSSLTSSAAARSLTRLGMGHSVQPAFFGRNVPEKSSSHSHHNSKHHRDYDEDEDDFEDDTTIVIAPHDVTAALSQPAASFGFVPPHLVSDLPEY